MNFLILLILSPKCWITGIYHTHGFYLMLDQTQGSTHARQAFCQLSYMPSLIHLLVVFVLPLTATVNIYCFCNFKKSVVLLLFMLFFFFFFVCLLDTDGSYMSWARLYRSSIIWGSFSESRWLLKDPQIIPKCHIQKALSRWAAVGSIPTLLGQRGGVLWQKQCLAPSLGLANVSCTVISTKVTG